MNVPEIKLTIKSELLNFMQICALNKLVCVPLFFVDSVKTTDKGPNLFLPFGLLSQRLT